MADERRSSNPPDAPEPERVHRLLRTFICTELLGRPSYPLDDDERLMTSGLIDSYSVARLGVFIEHEFDRYIPNVDLTVENMDTLRQLVAMVMEHPG